jgi:Fic family protein
VRTDGAWEEWLIYMLDGVEQMAGQTTRLVHRIRDLMLMHKVRIRSELPRIYSQDLLNNIFSHPYSKIAFVERDLGVSRITATRYLDELARIGVMTKMRSGRDNYYVNEALFDLLGRRSTV